MDFEKKDLQDWLRSPITVSIIKLLEGVRNETLEATLYTSRDERADVTFRVEGMDYIIKQLKQIGE